MTYRNRPGTLGTRVRKNVKDLSQDEFGRFVNILKTMKSRTRPGGVVSLYDKFSAIHMGAVELNRYWRRKNSSGPSDTLSSTHAGPPDPAHDNPG